MRAGPHCGHMIMTFDTAMRDSRSAMPPLICLPGLGRVCRLIIITCSTRIFPRFSSTLSTRPVFPLSRPVITFTVSFFLSWIRTGSTGLFFLCAIAISDHLGGQGNDLHEFLVAQLARHRTEDARTDRLA